MGNAATLVPAGPVFKIFVGIVCIVFTFVNIRGFGCVAVVPTNLTNVGPVVTVAAALGEAATVVTIEPIDAIFVIVVIAGLPCTTFILVIGVTAIP